jgi:hypothetical protein
MVNTHTDGQIPLADQALRSSEPAHDCSRSTIDSAVCCGMSSCVALRAVVAASSCAAPLGGSRSSQELVDWRRRFKPTRAGPLDSNALPRLSTDQLEHGDEEACTRGRGARDTRAGCAAASDGPEARKSPNNNKAALASEGRDRRTMQRSRAMATKFRRMKCCFRGSETLAFACHGCKQFDCSAFAAAFPTIA